MSTSAPAVAVTTSDLQTHFSQDASALADDHRTAALLQALLDALEAGEVRAAEPEANGSWRVNPWVKQGILAAFRASPMAVWPQWPGGAVDKQLFPTRDFDVADGIRVVPGGTSVRRGAHLGSGTVVMPPSYLNVGAWVGSGTMVDSHVLVGSCAQVGRDVHLSAGVQVGGVLEPVGARPVIVEDGAFVGGQCGLYEGVRVGARAVLAPGTILTGGTTVYDLVNERTWTAEIPPGAVVVPGSRPARGSYAEQHRLGLYAPCIVKYRDAGTDAATTLEEALR